MSWNPMICVQCWRRYSPTTYYCPFCGTKLAAITLIKKAIEQSAAPAMPRRILCGMKRKGQWWFRVFGYGVSWQNTNVHPLVFSERHGHRKGFRIGKWQLYWLNRAGKESNVMSKCLLEKHGRCCCQCKFRLEAHDHPMGSKIGWACIAFAFMEGEPIAYIGDFEHGICEMFQPLPWGDNGEI